MSTSKNVRKTAEMLRVTYDERLSRLQHGKENPFTASNLRYLRVLYVFQICNWLQVEDDLPLENRHILKMLQWMEKNRK